MKFPLHKPTLELLEGLEGVELGPGAHNPFGVRVLNVSPQRPEDEVFRQHEIELCGEAAEIHIVGHAADIPIDDDSQDFVLSSHVLEHAPDLLAAFVEMGRVVRPGGYIVLIFPQPNALPADKRPLSEIADIKKAHKEGWTWETAPEDAAFNGVGGHYWKLTCERFKELVEGLYRKTKFWPGLKWGLVGEEDPDTKVGNGFWLAYRVKK